MAPLGFRMGELGQNLLSGSSTHDESRHMRRSLAVLHDTEPYHRLCWSHSDQRLSCQGACQIVAVLEDHDVDDWLSVRLPSEASHLEVVAIDLGHTQRAVADADAVVDCELCERLAVDEDDAFDRGCKVVRLRGERRRRDATSAHP
jgi:hypothetical protein